jgi:hypothetical protein
MPSWERTETEQVPALPVVQLAALKLPSALLMNETGWPGIRLPLPSVTVAVMVLEETPSARSVLALAESDGASGGAGVKAMGRVKLKAVPTCECSVLPVCATVEDTEAVNTPLALVVPLDAGENTTPVHV